MADLNTPRGLRPQNQNTNNYNKNYNRNHNRNKNKPTGEKIVNGAFNGAKKAKSFANKMTDVQASYVAHVAKKAFSPFNDNLFPNLSPEEHRAALIESCINTDEIFKDKITDPANKSASDIRDYMFYNQLYFLAAAQIMQSGSDGSFLPGLVGGLSMIAGAALISDDFRKNLKEHAQDTLLKYVEPFKDSSPKLWQHLSAQVESHPGCACPESIALKLLRYQRQAADMVNNGDCDVKYADDLLAKKTSELKAAADDMNIEWSDVVNMRNSLSEDMHNLQKSREHSFGVNWQSEAVNNMEAKEPGLSKKVGNAREWDNASDWSAPIDVASVANRLMVYQKELQEAVEQLHNKKDGDTIDPKYTHLAGKSEAEYFAAAIHEVAELKMYAKNVLDIKWDDVTREYDAMNRKEYDLSNGVLEDMKKYVVEDGLQKYLPDGSENPNFGKPNEEYFKAFDAWSENVRKQDLTGENIDIKRPPKLVDGRIADFIKADDEIREHNKHMYYELPVDAASAGRCLKKYQQEAYECVRGLNNETIHKSNDGHTVDSMQAYTLANDLCKNVRAAADILDFNWSDSVKAYRKDVYNTVLKNPSKGAIWKEIVDGDIITNIPKSTTTYKTVAGHTVKEVKPLDRKEQIAAWDGAIYNTDGSRISDDVLMQVRNPYTKDEASKALYNLFVDDFKLQLQETNIRDSHEELVDGVKTLEPKYQHQIDSINDERKDITKRRDDLLNAFSSDHFSPELIDEIKSNAMKWFEDAKNQMTGNKSNTKSDVELDESLAPKDDTPELPDNSMQL